MSSRIALSLAALAALLFSLPAIAQEPVPPQERYGEHGAGWFDRLRGHALFPVNRARIGVQVQPMTPELRSFMGAPEDRGVLVERVIEDSPAQRAGLEVGDVIIAAGEHVVDGPADLVRAVHAIDAGSSLEIVHVRGGEQRRTDVEPEAVPDHRRGHAFEHHGPACTETECRHHPAGQLRKRLDEVEKRLRELEKHVLPGLDNAETST